MYKEEMYKEDLDKFVVMSYKAGHKVDYVQAGGGNTSVKFKDGYMAIKASGYLLKDMTENSGFVVVNGAEIWTNQEKLKEVNRDCSKEIMDIAIASIKQINGEKQARPSLEVGFHSLLGKYVLHLHPVYINILMCSKGGVEKAIEIAHKAGLTCISVPYAMPGFKLTTLIQAEMKEYGIQNYNSMPQIVFLKNHGLITHGDTAKEAIDIMDKIVEAVINNLDIPPFPQTGIVRYKDSFKSTNLWMKQTLQEKGLVEQLINSPVYPDQLVYTANELSIGKGESKIVISDGEIIYNSGEKEAIALEETMTALVYMYYCINKLHLEKELLSDDECVEVLGGDSEKYRKSLMSGK